MLKKVKLNKFLKFWQNFEIVLYNKVFQIFQLEGRATFLIIL